MQGLTGLIYLVNLLPNLINLLPKLINLVVQ